MRRSLAVSFFLLFALALATACANQAGGSASGTAGGGATGIATVGTGGAVGGASAITPGASGTPLAAGAQQPNPANPASPVSSPATVVVAGGQPVTVNMTDANQFQPASITVARGTTVTWVNTGQTPHTVTDDASKAANPADAVLPSGAQPWDSGTLAGGASYSHTFDTPGQYTYVCIPHESLGMIGRVTVTP